MSDVEEFASVRTDPDPLSRGRRATQLLTLYQQRATELARLRRAAVEEAHDERGMSYTEIAQALGLTKGRITQIRGSAPTAERAFFGVGPVSIGIPFRYQTTDRARPLIAAEDSAAAEQVEVLLADLGLAFTRFQVEPDRQDLPSGETVVICGPKSAPLASNLLDRDPHLALVSDEQGRWWIENAALGERHGSPTDERDAPAADLAYVARHRQEDGVTIHIAGLHAIGSLGAVHYLRQHLAEIYNSIGEESCSFIVRANYDGLQVTSSELVAGPFGW